MGSGCGKADEATAFSHLTLIHVPCVCTSPPGLVRPNLDNYAGMAQYFNSSAPDDSSAVELSAGSIPFYPGFHNWEDEGGPGHGAGECASFVVASGKWAAVPCAAAAAAAPPRRTVVCCKPPNGLADLGIKDKCSPHAVKGSSNWPLVPFLYRDDLNMDDIPNTEEEIAQGFETSNAFFIGNTALSRLILDEVELCVEDTAADIQLCRTIEKAMLSAAGSAHQFSRLGQDAAVNSLHKMIAILSGQLAPTIKESELLISLGDTPQAMVSTNPKLCATNQSTGWGSPVHCWMPCVRPFACGVKPIYRDYQGYTRISDITQSALFAQGAWGFTPYGLQLNPRDTKQEMVFGSERDQFITTNGAKSPWNVVYVRAKGHPRTSTNTRANQAEAAGNTVNEDALRCTPIQPCDTSAAPDIVCTDNKQISTVPNIQNRDAVKVDMHSNALTKVARLDFSKMGRMEELDLDLNVITSIEAHALDDCVSLFTLRMSNNFLEYQGIPGSLFKNAIRLDTVFMSNNQLTKLPGELFRGLVNLKTIGIHYNKFESMPSDLVKGLPELEFYADSLSTNVKTSDAVVRYAPGFFDKTPKLKLAALWIRPKIEMPTNLFAACPQLYQICTRDHPRPRPSHHRLGCPLTTFPRSCCVPPGFDPHRRERVPVCMCGVLLCTSCV